MIMFKTLKEKSAEWNISLRHLQYLCKKGGIDGAIKKAGAWFIPDNAPIPTQYTRIGDGPFNFVGTRKKIFECAIKLFQTRGFEAVSIKDIADNVGITQSSIYNHFKSKHEILYTIYDFYRHYFLENRPRLEEIEPILRNGSLLDIIMSMSYKFSGDYLQQMTDITAIIFHRCAIDDKAKELTKSLMIDEGIRFVEDVFNRAVEIGRLAPMDTRVMARLINSIRIFSLYGWLADPSIENYLQMGKDECDLCQCVSKLLTDLKCQS